MEWTTGLQAVVMLALTVGMPLVWAVLLNHRDRRQARLLQAVLDQVSSPDLRGRVAVRVRSGVLWPRSRLEVSVLSWSPQEIWELMTRLSECLSSRVRLEVTGSVDRVLLATFTAEGRNEWRCADRPSPSLATG